MLTFQKFFKKPQIIKEAEESTDTMGAEIEGHLSHLEDLAIEKGIDGFNEALVQVNHFYKHIIGLGSISQTGVNLKVDGSPSLFFGADPGGKHDLYKKRLGQFFIATKSVFSSTEPKLIYSVEDVDKFYTDESLELKNILKTVLPYLKAGYDGSGNVYNGDLLFSPERPALQRNINGEEFITFRPNTIEYAVPVDDKSELYQNVKDAVMGIIVHSKCHPRQQEDGSFKLFMASRDVTSVVATLKNVRGVFAEGSAHQNLNIAVAPEEKAVYEKFFADARTRLKNIDVIFNQQYISNKLLVATFQKYLNYTVRQSSSMFKPQNVEGGIFINSKEYLERFKTYLSNEYDKAGAKLKAKGQANAKARKDQALHFINSNADSFINLIDATYDLSQIKLLIHRILSNNVLPALKGLRTFTYQNGGYVDMSGEGHVLYIGTSANRVKIVDRIEFSKQNFEVGGRRNQVGAAPITEESPAVVPNKTVGICFGRWNPPHKGHMAAWEKASTFGPFYIGTNENTVGPDDPLPFNVKVACMESIWPRIKGHILAEKSLLYMASKVYSLQGDNVDLKVCTDENWLVPLLKKYNGKEGVYGQYNFANIEQVFTPRLSSATSVRKAVRNNDKEAFAAAAGVPPNTTIVVDGLPVNFFDIVAHYLSQYPTR